MKPEHERAWVLRQRAASWRREGLVDAGRERAIAAQLEQPWRVHGPVIQALFFVLTAIGTGAAYGVLRLAGMSDAGIPIGIAALVLAEVLIRKAQWFWTGVEASLWICGLLALISELPSRGTPESLLVLAAAFAVAGARVRNPLLGLIAAIIVAWYFEEKLDGGVVAGLAMSLGASVLLLRTWRRPSTEWLLIAITLLLPLAVWPASDANWRVTTIALYAVFAAGEFALAIVSRHHAYFLSSMVAAAVAAGEAARVSPLPLELRLALGGVVLLAIAVGIARLLRERTSGFVTTPAELTSFDEVIEGIATISVQPRPEAPQPEPGGRFGGAGASGDY